MQTAPVQASKTVLTPALIARIRKGLVGTLRDLRYSGNPRFNPVPKLLRLTCVVPIDAAESLSFTFEIRSDLALLIRPEERASEIIRMIMAPDFDPTDSEMLAAAVNSEAWKAA